jgi:integrase
LAKIFRKWACPSAACRRWYRKSGTCKCGSQLAPRGSWSLDYFDGHGRRRVEDIDATSKRAAERELSIRIGDADRGHSKPRHGDTFEKVADEYLKLRSSQKADGGKRDEYALKHLTAHFGAAPIGGLQERDGLAYIAKRGTAARPATVAKEMRLAKSIWKFARANYGVQGDPFAGITVKEPRRPIKNLPNLEDEEQIWNALPPEPLPLYQFLAYTGARTKEGRLLKKADIETEKRLAWVMHKTRAGDIEREPLFLDDNALAVLKRALETSPDESEYVFVNPKTGKPYVSPTTTFRRIMKRIGLDHKIKSPHDLRHLFVTRLVEANIHPTIGMRLSRHRDPRSWARYEHAAPQSLIDAVKTARPQQTAPAAGTKRGKLHLSPAEMTTLLKEKSLKETAKTLSVTPQAIIKFCKKHELKWNETGTKKK